MKKYDYFVTYQRSSEKVMANGRLSIRRDTPVTCIEDVADMEKTILEHVGNPYYPDSVTYLVTGFQLFSKE